MHPVGLHTYCKMMHGAHCVKSISTNSTARGNETGWLTAQKANTLQAGMIAGLVYTEHLLPFDD